MQIKADIATHSEGKIFREDVEWVHGIRTRLHPKSAIATKITGVHIVNSGPDAGKKIL